MATDELKSRPGYRIMTVPNGAQKGQKILRCSWPEQRELRKLGRLAQESKTEDPGADDGPGESTLAMYKMLAGFIPEWTLVDQLGKDLPQPQDDPQAFERLDSYTLTYFVPWGKDSLWKDVLPNVS